MQVQTIDTLANAVLRPPVLQSEPALSQWGWHCLPLHWLENFAPVAAQFTPWQVQFEGAIAIRPSNPRFQTMADALVIMPNQAGKSLKVNLGPTIDEIDLWVVGSEAVTVSLLDAVGHCVAVATTTPAPTAPNPITYPTQRLTLDTHNAHRVRIDSRSPFILTHVAVHSVAPR